MAAYMPSRDDLLALKVLEGGVVYNSQYPQHALVGQAWDQPSDLNVNIFPPTRPKSFFCGGQEGYTTPSYEGGLYGVASHWGGLGFAGQDFQTPQNSILAPEHQLPRLDSPAHGSNGDGSQWSTSHYDEVPTPQTPLGSNGSASDHERNLNFKDFTAPSIWPVRPLTGGGVAMSAIQTIPDAHEAVPGEYGSCDADADEDHVPIQPHCYTVAVDEARNDGTGPDQDEPNRSASENPEAGGNGDGDNSGDWSPRQTTKYRPRRRRDSGADRCRGHKTKSSAGQSTRPPGTPAAGRDRVRKPKRHGPVQNSDCVTDAKRAFPCPFARYNCNSTFKAKNEWKRHVSTQHIRLGFWRCDMCPQASDASPGTAEGFNDFNRKDLFTQHLRRMHLDELGLRDADVAGQLPPVNDPAVVEAQRRCYVQARSTPPASSCLLCPRDFRGLHSWAERMDHVGGHFEQERKLGGGRGVAGGSASLDVTSWREDPVLEKWLAEEGLIVWGAEQREWTIGSLAADTQ